ncbi:wax ester/triacylglycerol synthase family O-acyltransferase [Quisquiliibacterium transsilvanicum]|uniref:diacylglycerol O-acyltransferase n=1 Tax=Quisquiliibacterium transsilvanicum TaxID=1549638 RepID=A0A7W8HKI3_9BURK|nr:wax ester/triacylglycerol synthase family O-acyltransferase [Quisquiliibacterium transsilvanicum]MBB5273767.1 WS/DGAT/MGAT family acyltransferase [Quisquiliibacterium transsilvanicum]
MTLHKMAPVDAAWYHMDGRANLAMVTSVALTSKPLDFAAVKALYAERLAGFPRFRQRVVEHGWPIPSPHWEDMPDFDMGQHLHHVALPPPGGRRALTELLNDIVSTPLDRLQPLWQVHVIDGVDGGSALVTRFHHCMGDGTSMAALSMRLYDMTPAAPGRRGKAAAAPIADGDGDGDRDSGWLDPAFDLLVGARRAAVSTASTVVDAVRHPQALIDRAALLAGGAGMLLTELLKRDDPRSPFKGDFSLAKRVAWSEPVAIDDVKAIGALAGAKVNDVLVAGMTGALRAYLKKRGVDVEHTTLRAMVPVDLRPPERALELGNDFGLVLLELAVAARTPMARLRVTKENMDALKRSPEPMAMRVLFDIFGRTPKAVSDIPSSMLSSKASVVMTNVMGPPQTLHVAGVPIERVMFWVPHPGEHLGMGISILSYRGKATLAIVADAHLVPDPETITQRFQKEFVTMLAAARRAKGQGQPATRKPAAAAASAPRRRNPDA